MKKIILLLMTLALGGWIQNACAQGSFKNADAAVDEAESIIRGFKGSPDADVLSIGSMLINMVKPFVDEPEAKAVLKIANGLLVADLENCSSDIKNRFSSQMGKYIQSLGEFKLMEVRDGEDNVIVIGNEDKISGMLVCGSDSEVVLIKLAAKPEELEKLLQSAR